MFGVRSASLGPVAALALSLPLLAQPAAAQQPLSSAFTYQGRLNTSGVPASGSHDFEFGLYDAPAGGNQIGTTVTALGTPVNGGLFGVSLDFGAGAFAGERRWLMVTVRPAGPGAYTLLSPNTEVTPAPHATFALSAATATSATSAQVAQSATTAITATNATNATTAANATTATTALTALNATTAANAGLATTATVAVTALNANTVGGVTSASLSDNRPPVALMDSDKITVELGSAINSSVVFSLGQSYDPENGSLVYGFDLLGNQAGQPTFSSVSTATLTYTQAGNYLAEGWVRDGANFVARDKIQITAVQGGGLTNADASPNRVGLFNSMAVVSGNPAVSYYDITVSDLKYVRATDASGSAWATPVTIDSVSSVGLYTSLAVVNGNPAIAYYDQTNGDLKYVRATDATGATWGTPVAVDTSGTVGLYPSLAVVNG